MVVLTSHSGDYLQLPPVFGENGLGRGVDDYSMCTALQGLVPVVLTHIFRQRDAIALGLASIRFGQQQGIDTLSQAGVVFSKQNPSDELPKEPPHTRP